jgi:hypothetical protein
MSYIDIFALIYLTGAACFSLFFPAMSFLALANNKIDEKGRSHTMWVLWAIFWPFLYIYILIRMLSSK